jgi:choline dehydrogenase-like flavoprotein
VKPIEFDTAVNERWDAVIAGTSFASLFFALGLPAGSRVLFLEKGERYSHPERLKQRGQHGAETFTQRSTASIGKVWIAHSTFGGNSNCWWGCTPRFHPHDFQLRTRHGAGMDWPISYNDLEETYCDVEAVMDIAGGGSDAALPRSRPFTSPPHRPSLSDQKLREASPLWWAQPTARSNGARRPPCCGNGVCNLCPIDAKFTILNSLSQFERPGFHYLTGWEVRSVARSAGLAAGLEARHSSGREAVFRGSLVALGANAIFNAAILLRSGFTNPHLGRNLHEQTSRVVLVDAPMQNFHGGTSITGHGYHFYHGADRSKHAAVLVENWNAPASIRMEPNKWTQRLVLKLLAEDMPQADNRVELQSGEPVIHWRGHHDYGLNGLERAVSRLQDIIPVPIERMHPQPHTITEAHIQGTHRMAATASDGVVDKNLRTFECVNVYALGAGAFPTCSPANPTLTLSALSLRAARLL